MLHLLYATGLRLPEVEAPELNKWQRLGPREAIAASTFYDQMQAFFGDCADVLRGRAM